ncbi:MAG: hypothetical protein WBQ60_08275 [Asticcacaulis sp.]
MPLPAYPIAIDAHEALSLLRSGAARRAVREKEAEQAAGSRTALVTQSVGPLFDTREAALSAYAGLIEDDRPDRAFVPADSDRVCKLVCRPKEEAKRKTKHLKPEFAHGTRWPKPKTPAETVWQLSISYWKILTKAQAKAAGLPPVGQARHLRKKATGKDLTPAEISALSQGPLMAARPQKPLDIGLFDFPLPENPSIIIADE